MTTLPPNASANGPEMPPTLPGAVPGVYGAALEPVRGRERVGSVDVLRGVALLGILMMNIIAFAYPSMAYVNPDLESLRAYAGEFSGANKAAWWVAHTFFDLKMMSIFSMLFGAGVVLMDDRATPRGEAGAGGAGAREGRRGFGAIYYRRLGWLFAIGMLHAYLIWWGDILVAYALCGLLLYPLRRVRAGWLITMGIVLTLVGVAMGTGLGALLNYFRAEAMDAQRVLDAGGVLTADQRDAMGTLKGMNEAFNPPVDEMTRTITMMRGSYVDGLQVNALQAIMLQTFVFVLFTVWRALGMMLIGMGLAKLGVFAAARSRGWYIGLVAAGYGVGLPLVHVGGQFQVRSGFDMIDHYYWTSHFNYVGSFFVALGHIGVVMLACRAVAGGTGGGVGGALAFVTSRLAAVGQMALTNYLMQSILCSLYFNGWGFGQYARLERAETYIVVAAVWALELIWSPLWLARFRFGPAEWVWRSLTYWKWQPMRRERGMVDESR